MFQFKTVWFALNAIINNIIIYEHCNLFLNHIKILRFIFSDIDQKNMFKRTDLEFFDSFKEMAEKLFIQFEFNSLKIRMQQKMI